MTFAEYNTDENFDRKESSLDELVKLGIGEGKSPDDIRKSLSPKWQKSKKIGEFDDYVKQYSTAPKAEAEENKPTEEKVLEAVVTESAPETTLDKNTENFMNKNNAIADTQEDNEYERQRNELFKRWDSRNENITKMTNSMRRIDDHMIDQLPTFMFKRYQNGEFGDPKTSDAKLRLAHFMINGLGTALSNMGHKINKDGQMEESDIQKYNRTNLEEGLANRWNKYKQETQSAIDVAKQGGMSEEDVTDSIAKISSNNRLQSAFNQMNERQKVFALNVLAEIGNKMGNMNDAEFANTLMGMSAMGDSLDYKEAAGMLIYRFIKDPEKRDKALSELGLLGGGNPVLAGFGMGLAGDGKKDDNGTGTTLSDGSNYDPGKAMSKKELEEGRTKATQLMKDYADGKISKEQFENDYKALYDVISSHGVRTAISGGIVELDEAYNKLGQQYAMNKLGKKANNGMKIANFFKENEQNRKLFDYLMNNPNAPMPIEDKASFGIKDLKDYQKKQKDFMTLYNADALELVTKY